MIATIRNVGRTRVFPTRAGNIRIPQLSEIRIADAAVVKEIMQSANLLVDWTDDDGLSIPERGPKKIDYSLYRISELRSIAASLKVPGFFTMRKVDLIKILTEEQKNEK